MKVIRKQTIDTETFELGDEIRFTLTTGEKVRAKAVQEYGEETPFYEGGMLFLTRDCVGKEVPMYENPQGEYLDYLHSDLRKYLNNELLSIFPDEIRSRMIPMMIDDSYGDYLRIPTEKEIVSKTYFSTYDTYTKPFRGMKHLRNRITTNGDEPKQYWLQNSSCVYFANVSVDGEVLYSNASLFSGVRLVFELSSGESDEV